MKKLLLLLISIQFFQVVLAQQITVSGIVSSSDGELLPGVNVVIDGTTIGTTTDFDGKYQISVKTGEKLIYSFIGFKKEEMIVTGETVLDVVLAPDLTDLDEVVVVGYGETKRITSTGSVSAIQARELKTIPTSSVQNALYGKMPGFFTQQRSGQPGKDASDFFIRGASSLNAEGNQPLIIVDDVQYSFDQLSQINVNEIESISILKDASTTAVYGIKGANGVLVVKTRRGKEGKPKVNLRVESGIQTPVRKPKFLNSYQTAKLVNEAYANDGLQPQFSQEDLDLFQSGEDPYGHPDVDWYDEIFKKVAFQHNANIDFSGGTERLKYFISGGAFTQNGLIEDFNDPYNEVNSNYFYRRFDYRTNLDFDVTNTLKLRLDITSRFGNINQPRGQNVVGEIYNFSKIHPYSSPVMNPNGTYSYAYDTDEKLPTLNARIANGGYERIRRSDYNVLFGATQKLDFLVKGLEASGRVAFSSIEENNRQVFRSSFPTYHYDAVNDSYSIDPRGQYAYGSYAVLGSQNRFEKDLNIQAFLRYDKQILFDHNLNVMLLYNRQSRTSKSNVPANFEGYTAKVSYNYRDKYLIDFNGAYNGTDRFGSDNRFGFFPAVGVGYAISEEPFFKDAFSNVQLFKIRASYGLVGSDVAPGNRYLYRQVYQTGYGYNFGESVWAAAYPNVYEGSLGNDNVTWEKARKFDVGIDANLFDKVSLTIDYFYDYRFDQLVTKQDVPAILGIGISPSNIAETENRGFDGKIDFQTKIFKDFHFNTSFVFSYAKNKVLYKAEAEQAYPWLQETGRPIGQPFGYTFVGFYSQDDIDMLNDNNPDNDVATPLNDVPVQAGDLKYADLNEDGVIDNFDRGPIGKPNLPNTTLGWSLGGYFKGFTVNVLFQGSFNYSFSVVGTGIEPFKSQFQPIHLDRWTPETAETATFPRLTSNPTTVNSGSAYMSDFWLVDAWYMRLKTVDLGYQIPQRVLPFNLNSARLYVNAYNLFTWTSYDKYQQDPEISTNTAGDAYMNQRVVNLGLQITF
ncbi:TonB-dependent receptor [uncultured Draconibacterium sp.]|uniref:SusC/RagA family TonB-linked outer membrane protein n=1 Tax=uncultured Draconibacterium sp. TaxID=1573823 RepID=UPI0029C94CBA|nr:TonB-dependent receptor [uncultured Draconibacterium sp.]